MGWNVFVRTGLNSVLTGIATVRITTILTIVIIAKPYFDPTNVTVQCVGREWLARISTAGRQKQELTVGSVKEKLKREIDP
jgi:hypothetical protein